MRALARIDHPGVVGILDVGELEDGSPFLVIQHIPGVSLRQALSEGPIAAPRIAQIVRQIGAALRAAHAAGVSHRDLKPENIMLHPLETTGGELVKLIDFGVAKIDKSGLESHATTVMLAGPFAGLAAAARRKQSIDYDTCRV
jgi:serine/threonine protein kinase